MTEPFVEVVGETRLAGRVAELGVEISADYEGKAPVFKCGTVMPEGPAAPPAPAHAAPSWVSTLFPRTEDAHAHPHPHPKHVDGPASFTAGRAQGPHRFHTMAVNPLKVASLVLNDYYRLRRVGRSVVASHTLQLFNLAAGYFANSPTMAANPVTRSGVSPSITVAVEAIRDPTAERDRERS